MFLVVRTGRLSSLVALAVLSAACGQPPTSTEPSSTVTALTEDDQVSLATVVYLLETKPWKDYWGDSAAKRYLEVDRNDPSDELLERLESHASPLLPASLCRASHEGVFEKDTGTPALLYKLSRLETPKDGGARVRAFLQSVGWGGISVTLTLEKTNGDWAVVGEGEIAKA